MVLNILMVILKKILKGKIEHTFYLISKILSFQYVTNLEIINDTFSMIYILYLTAYLNLDQSHFKWLIATYG